MISINPIISKWRTKITGILIVGLGAILIVVAVLFISNHVQTRQEVHLGSSVFNVRLAETEFARQKGLSGVESMAANEGLLMAFAGDNQWGIWMKDMKIPLDIVWLDTNKKVIYIVTDALPSLGTSKTFQPDNPARYVLEVPAGSVKSGAIKIGDVASFTLEREE